MHLSKLVKTLLPFHKTDIKRLQLFVQSPYYQVPEAARQLMSYVARIHPDLSEKKMQPLTIARHVKQLPTAKKQSNAATELMKAVGLFLATEQFLCNKPAQTLYRLKALRQLHLTDTFEAELQEANHQLDTCPEQNIDTFMYRHLLTELAFNGYEAKQVRNLQNNISPVLQTLDAWYALKKLRYMVEQLNRHIVLGTAYSEDNLPYLLQVLQPYNQPQYRYVYHFINIYQLLKAEDYEAGLPYYQRLKQDIELHTAASLPPGMAETVEYIEGYLLYWSNRGILQATQALTWLFDLKINQGLLLQDGKIQPAVFRNVVTTSVKAQREANHIKWFIDTYTAFLPHEHQPTNVAFTQAVYQYYLKNYPAAMPLFQQAQVKDEPMFNVIVRRWQFMCLYEQNPENIDTLSAYLSAFDKYMQRNADNLHRHLPVFQLFVASCKKLLTSNTPAGIQQNMEALNREPFFAGKDWLQIQYKQKSGQPRLTTSATRQ
ncbi:MAG: hypothetical protein U0T74_09340 [Chitinophagales bacterium]